VLICQLLSAVDDTMQILIGVVRVYVVIAVVAVA
jgi:hypothetical protein